MAAHRYPLDAVATCDQEQESWRLALVNRLPDCELDCKIRMEGTPLHGTHRATLLSGDSPNAYNDVGTPDRVIPQQSELAFLDGAISLPPHSVTILEVRSQ